MFDSRLLETIKVLKKEELDDFRLFLNSNSSLKGIPQKNALSLFDYIIAFYPNFEEETLNKAFVVTKLSKANEFSVNKLEKMMSALLNELEIFISNHMKEDSFHLIKRNIVLAHFYESRGINHRSETFLKRIDEYFENNNKGLNLEYYQWYLAFLEELIKVPEILKKKQRNISDLIEYNKIIFLIKNLEQLTKTVYRKLSFDEDSLKIFHEIELIIEQSEKFRKVPLINLYCLALNMLNSISKEDNLYYNTYKTILQENNESISKEDGIFFYNFERTYVNKRYNLAQTEENTKMVFDVHKAHLEKGYLFINGILLKNAVINLLLLSVKQKDGEWIHSFLTEREHQIGTPENRVELLNYGWSNYYFLIKDFDKANESLSFNYTDTGFLLFARRLRLKILFEQDEIYSLTYEGDAFKVYIYRLFKKETINQNIFDFNNNFIDLLRQLITLNHNPHAKKKETLLKKIQEQKCADKEWLLDKVALIKV